MLEQLLKVILLFIAGYLYQVSFTPPNPAPALEERMRYGESLDLLNKIRGPWMRRATIVCFCIGRL